MAARTPEIAAMTVLLLSPFIMVVVHMICSRVFTGSSAQVVAVQSVIVSVVPTMAVEWAASLRFMSGAGRGVSLCYSLIVYAGIASAYFHFFNMSETARRVRILYEIYRAGQLPIEKFFTLYRTDGIIKVRLERLVAMKQLGRRREFYVIAGRTLFCAARLVAAWRRLLMVRGSRIPSEEGVRE